jgi:hypothetical protein
MVTDPDGLRTACADAEIPEPKFDTLTDRWDIGNTVASQRVWQAQAKPRYAWQGLVKRLDPAPALGS